MSTVAIKIASFLALAGSSAMYAQTAPPPSPTATPSATPATTMTCIGGSGPTLTLPVYALTADLTTSLATSLITVYTAPQNYNELASRFFFDNTFNSCTFNPSVGGTAYEALKILSVSLAGAGAGVESTAPRAYASVTLSYGVIAIGSTSISTNTSNATAEDKAKALAAHQAKGLALPKTN